MSYTLAPSYSALATREAGAVVAELEQRKRAKYSHLDSSHFFLCSCGGGDIGGDGATSLGILAGGAAATSDPLSHQSLLQCVAIAVQRGNAVVVLETAERDSAVGYEQW